MKYVGFSILVIILSGLFLKAQQRTTLIEQFSNSSCGPCAAVSPVIYDFADHNLSKTIVIAYHTAFPYYNDSMYFENPVEATQRVNFYSVGSVPHTVLDGTIYNGSSNSFTPGMGVAVDNRVGVAPRYAIGSLSLGLTGNQLSGSFEFISMNTSNTSETLSAHLVIVEKNVLKSAYAASPGANTETEYKYVMRKMLPGASGTTLINTSLNGKDTVSFNWTLQHIKDVNELIVVAFVQNVATKEIYQAEAFTKEGTPVGLSKNSSALNEMRVYPNPAKDRLLIALNKKQYIGEVAFINQLGETVYSEFINAFSDSAAIVVDLDPGIYYLRISNGGKDLFTKIVVAPW